MSWGLIPWSETIHKKMTYRKLLEQLQRCPTETLDKEVMLYSIANDEFIPAYMTCLLYTSPSPRDATLSRMPSSA